MKKTPFTTKPRKRLPAQSERRKVEAKLWELMKKKKLREEPRCQFHDPSLPGTRCKRKSTDVHHKAGRHRHLLTYEFLMACCRGHHDWIDTHRATAEKMGFIVRDRSPYDPQKDSRKISNSAA